VVNAPAARNPGTREPCGMDLAKGETLTAGGRR
jgi:hypothetical protein